MYAIVADAGGAHEADCVYSIWTTPELAEAERVRLTALGRGGGCNGGGFHVIPVIVDMSSDTWIAA